ncbi:MAG: GNAT family N-acetyltransferase [Chloroflexota bacterium]|nr:GNAT family N-acetyltransferase [Chloroflexota bacterium]
MREDNMEIRPMLRRDKPAVMRILKATPEFKPSEVVIAEELLDSYLNSPTDSGYYVLVAEVDSAAVAGYVCYGPTPLTETTWDIYWMAVDPELKGRGIGNALLSAAEEQIRTRHGRLAVIETSGTPQYEKTRHFYFARGWEKICQIADFYAPGDDQVLFIKRL